MPSRAPRNIARAPRSERRRRARPGFPLRSGSRSRIGLRFAGAALGTAGATSAGLRLKGSDTRLQCLVFLASSARHGLHSLELVPTYKVGAAHPLLELFARGGF